MAADRKISEVIPEDLLREYELKKDSVKDVTISDVNNISQALMEMSRKGVAPRGGGCQICCCAICCCAAAVKA